MAHPIRIYLASSSAGKLKDFAAAAHGDVELVPLPGLAEIAAPVEDERSFAGNARAKALGYAREAARRMPELNGSLVLADDSGLEVDALDGEPGVRSARYADDHGFEGGSQLTADERNNRLLLARLAEWPDRSARYCCALALARCGEPPVLVAEAEGKLEGEILVEPRGTGGFGYDPLFCVREAGRTMAELAMDERLQFSHRGRALRRLLAEQVWMR